MLSSGKTLRPPHPSNWADWAIRYGVEPATGCRPMMVVPRPPVLVAPSLKLHTMRSPAVISPDVIGAIPRPYGLPPPSIGSSVEPMVVIVFNVIKTGGLTVTVALVADMLPPDPVHVSI